MVLERFQTIKLPLGNIGLFRSAKQNTLEASGGRYARGSEGLPLPFHGKGKGYSPV